MQKYFFFTVVEYENEYYFTRTKLNWEALEEAPYAAYGSITSFIGTTFMITVMSKYFKMTDTVLAIVSSSLTAVSKLVCVSIFSNEELQVLTTTMIINNIFTSLIDNSHYYLYAIHSKNYRYFLWHSGLGR